MANSFTPNEISQILEEFFKVVGTRQYIGARYVPIFGRKGEESIVWDNTAPYEPLTIVLYQGNSFTSRQFVPIGVDIDNTDFWAETGNYNAQIEQYRQEVQAILDRVSQTAIIYENVAAMKQGNFNLGDYCKTLGFYNENDNGGGLYVITNDAANDMDIIPTEKGYSARLVIDGSVSIKQLGAVGDGVADDTDATQRAFEIMKNGGVVTCPSGTYLNSKPIYIGRNTTFRGIGRPKFTLNASDISGYIVGYNNEAPEYCAGFWFYDNLNDNHFCIIDGIEYDGKCEQNLSWPSDPSKRNNPSSWSGTDYEDNNWFHGIALDTVPNSNATIPQYMHIKNCYIHNTTRDCIVGKPYNIIIENCHLENSHVDHVLYLQCRDGYYSQISNCLFTGYARGMITAFGAMFNNCIFDDITQNPTGFNNNYFILTQDREGYNKHTAIENCVFNFNLQPLSVDNFNLIRCYGDITFGNSVVNILDSVSIANGKHFLIHSVASQSVIGASIYGLKQRLNCHDIEINSNSLMCLYLVDNDVSNRQMSIDSTFANINYNGTVTNYPSGQNTSLARFDQATIEGKIKFDNVDVTALSVQPIIYNGTVKGIISNSKLNNINTYNDNYEYINVYDNNNVNISEHGSVTGRTTVSYLSTDVGTNVDVALPNTLPNASYNVMTAISGAARGYKFFMSISSKSTTGFRINVFPVGETFGVDGENRIIDWTVVY